MKRVKMTEQPGVKLEAISPSAFKKRQIEFVVQNAAQLWLDNTKAAAIKYVLTYSRAEWFDEIVDRVIERVNELAGVPADERYFPNDGELT